MVRLLLFLTAFLGLISCSKPPGFKADNYDYSNAQNVVTKPTGDHAEIVYTPGEVKRNSQKLQLKPTRTEWKDKQLTLTADVKIKGKNLGSVQFQGQQVDSKIVLTPTDPELKDSLRARVMCTSEEGTCSDFFIEVVYREKDVLFHDQILAVPTDTAPVVPPKQVVPPPNQPGQPNQPAKPEAPLEDDDIFEFIDTEKMKNSGFIGGTDDEFWLMFDIEPSKRPGAPKPPPGSAPSHPSQPPTPPTPPTPPPAPQPPAGPGQPQNPPAQPPAPPVQPPTPPSQPGQPTKPPAQPPIIKPPIKDNPGGGKEEPPAAPPTVLQKLEKFKRTDQSVFYAGTIVQKNSQGQTIKVTTGRLERATDFRAVMKELTVSELGFRVADDTTNNFGSFHLLKTLAQVGQFMKEILPNRPLWVTSITAQNGGVTPAHPKSHQNGQDIDIRYLRDIESGDRDIVSNNRVTSNFLIREQWNLFKKIFQTGQVDLIFIDQVVKTALCEYAIATHEYKRGEDSTPVAEMLKRLRHAGGHEDHFHLRVKCTQSDPRCWPIHYKAFPVGC